MRSPRIPISEPTRAASIGRSGSNSLVIAQSTIPLMSMSAETRIPIRLRVISQSSSAASTGTYHHVSQTHLKRYLGEFDFRYNYRTALGFTDRERATIALKGIVGKRVTYRRAHNQAEEAGTA